MGDTLRIAIDGQDVRVKLRTNPRARRFILRIDPKGEPVLTAPPGADRSSAQHMLDRHRGWLSERLRRLPKHVPFQAGAIIPIRGEQHRLVRTAKRGSPVTIGREAVGPTLTVYAPTEDMAGRVRAYLTELAREDLRAACDQAATNAGVHYSRLRLSDPKSRWGSCSSLGTLSFSWRLIMAPPAVLQYLAAHEVAHLAEMNHGPAFWRLCKRLSNDMAFAETWLERHGRTLHRYG